MNDDIPEEKSFYEFQLTGISEGGLLSGSSSTANITMVASDFPYGRFSFSQEHLRVSEEAQRVECKMFKILSIIFGFHFVSDLFYKAGLSFNLNIKTSCSKIYYE